MEIFRKDSLILTRYYFSDYEEEHYADGRVRKIDYITGPTVLIGVNISTDGVDTLLYAFTDRFGNLVMLVDGDKNIVERLAYDPWGARRNPGDWTKPDTASHLLSRGYSMHEHLDCLGLINMNARVYEPATCSFLSPDPLIADEGNWLNYNRYLYCLGNPVKFADPTGMQVEDVDDLINYYKKLLDYSVPDVISGVTSSCVEQELDNYEMEMIDSYVSVNESPTSTIVYNGHIPVGENYINSRPSCYGGCTESTLLSVLDMYRINISQSYRGQLDKLRNKEGWEGNVFDRYNASDELTKSGLKSKVITEKKRFIPLIETMKEDGNVYAANISFGYRETEYGHNVVITGVRGRMIQYWDNASGNAGEIRSVQPFLIKELYQFSMSGFNPWLPVRQNIVIPSNSIYIW
jgi:RHS repeat-associated protein